MNDSHLVSIAHLRQFNQGSALMQFRRHCFPTKTKEVLYREYELFGKQEYIRLKECFG